MSSMLASAADGLIVVSRAMHEDYAVRQGPRNLGSGVQKKVTRDPERRRDPPERRKNHVTMAPSVSYSIT
ncbi:MAG TPA: hypothetical protein VMG13_21270, partial [Trebonia sp.]|nr:hypothetical protein [Trebonia sp.]